MQVWRQRLRPGDLFVDIGAHEGAYTLWALELGAEVLAAEPQEHLCEALRANLALNGYEADLRKVAVADRIGVMRMSGPDDNRWALATEGDPVNVTTLDDLVGCRHVAGVKIDIEGAERLALAGAARLLGEQRVDLIQLEWNDMSQVTLGEDRQPLLRLLADHGYVTARPDKTGRLHRVARPDPGADVFAYPAQ